MKYSKVIVTGGTGMVGRSLQEIMYGATFLSSEDFDLTIVEDVKKMYTTLQPDTVIHLAAKVGGILDNINKPVEYFNHNILMNTNVLKYGYEFGIKKFIGVLSTCVYPDKVDFYPMKENMLHIGPPTPTNFSYGYAKRALAVQIDAYNKQYGCSYQYLLPSNLYGEYDKWGENSHFVAALIKKIILAERNKQDTIYLYGTGAPLRQFMHSSDLARVIKHCIDYSLTESFNVSPTENISIREIAQTALDVIKPEHVRYISFDSEKPDGQFRKDVSNEKMLKLIPEFKFTSLRDGIRRTYEKAKTYNF